MINNTANLVKIFNTFINIVVTDKGVIVNGRKRDVLYIKSEAKSRFNIDIEIIKYVNYELQFDGYLIHVK